MGTRQAKMVKTDLPFCDDEIPSDMSQSAVPRVGGFVENLKRLAALRIKTCEVSATIRTVPIYHGLAREQ